MWLNFVFEKATSYRISLVYFFICLRLLVLVMSFHENNYLEWIADSENRLRI
jgi:hypothetical protein